MTYPDSEKKPSKAVRFLVLLPIAVVLVIAIRRLIKIAVDGAFQSGNAWLLVPLIVGLLGLAGFLRFRRLTRKQ